MGGKKRSLNSVEVAEDHLGIAKDEGAGKNADDSLKPMERRKKRKQQDKERRQEASEKNMPAKNINIALESQVNVQVSNTLENMLESEVDFLTSEMADSILESELDIQAPIVTENVLKSKVDVQATNIADRNGLPKFHIGVFKDLASANVSVREAAVETLVKELQEVQEAYIKSDRKVGDEIGLPLEADKDDGLDNCAPSLRYAIRRLIRGVSSSREYARQGFASGLAVLVGRISGIQFGSLLKLVTTLLEVTSSMKGQEAKDCLLGRLFAYGAIARSGRLITGWADDKNTPYIKEFISSLISLAAKKRYLQEPAVTIIIDLIGKLPMKALSKHVLQAPGLIDWFGAAVEAGNPDALLLALILREKTSVGIPVFGKLLPYPFSSAKFFSNDHLSSLANCLKESTFCQPRVHSVWPVLVDVLLPENILPEEDAKLSSNIIIKHKKSRKFSPTEEDLIKNIRCFCEIIIEGSLLISSHDRKHLAFDVLLLLLPRLPASCIPIVFSYKVVQCLIDILSTTDSWLYKVAQHFIDELSDLIGDDEVRRVFVIEALQKHSSGKFDCIARTKPVKKLMAGFRTETGFMMISQSLKNMFLDEDHASEEPSDQSQTTDDNSEIGSVEDKDSNGLGSPEFMKSWVVESLPSVLKYLKLDPEAKFRVQKETMKFLAVQGLFTASLGTEVTSFELQEKFRWPKSVTSIALCRICVEQLQLLLSNAQKGEISTSEANQDHDDLGSYFMRFLSTLRSIPSVSLFRSLSNEDEKAFKKLHAMEARLSKEERSSSLSSEANKYHALRYLLIQMELQVLLQPDEFPETASELIICCKKVLGAPDLSGSSEEDESDGDGDPELMDVLVDTLLSLLPQSSAPMRSAIEQVFKFFCGDVTDDGLLRMLRVIKKDVKKGRHSNAESDHDGDDDDDNDDFLHVEEEEESDEAETEETAESDGLTDDSEPFTSGDMADKELHEDSEDSDEGMDDDAMFRMDTYLARIFREKKNQSGNESTHAQLVLFKLRVLSLLEIYLHENPDKPQVLTIYTNLARVFVNPQTAEGSGQLGQRIWGILQKKIFKSKDCPKGDTLQLPELEMLLEKNLKLASRPFKKKFSSSSLETKESASWNRHKMICSLAEDSTLWILKIIDGRSFSPDELLRVLDLVRDAFIAFFDSKKSKLRSGFLKQIVIRRPWIGWQLFDFLLDKSKCAELEYRRVEALGFITELLKPLLPSDKKSGEDNARETKKQTLISQLPKLSQLLKDLIAKMPSKAARRREVRRFCGRVYQILSTHDLEKTFLNELPEDVREVCVSRPTLINVRKHRAGKKSHP